MQESDKDFFASKTTWGAVLILLKPVLEQNGVEVDVDVWTDMAVQVAGGILFFWGMFSKSRRPITKVAGVRIVKNQEAT